MARVIGLFTCLLVLPFVSGCGTLNVDVLLRDMNAHLSEVADTLMGVVDEPSAQYFQDVQGPRFKRRWKEWEERDKMLAKVANDDDKKRLKDFLEALGKAMKAVEKAKKIGAAPELPDMAEDFESYHLYRLAMELVVNFTRIDEETRRISARLGKATEARLFEIHEEWKAKGKPGVPRLGTDLDQQKEFPALWKLPDTLKDVLPKLTGV